MTKEAEMELVPRVKSVCSLQYEQYHLLHISYYIAHVAYVQVTSKSQVVIFKSQTNLESLWKSTPAKVKSSPHFSQAISLFGPRKS